MAKRKGFTLIELIIVIAIIAILAAAIFVAIDPARRLHESRNARRWSDINTILDAVTKYQADFNGTHYTAVDTLGANYYYTIGECTASGDVGCGAQITQSGCANLSLMPSNYLAKVPKDPRDGTDEKTDYYILKDNNGTITVGACDPEGGGPGGNDDPPEIEVTR